MPTSLFGVLVAVTATSCRKALPAGHTATPPHRHTVDVPLSTFPPNCPHSCRIDPTRERTASAEDF